MANWIRVGSYAVLAEPSCRPRFFTLCDKVSTSVVVVLNFDHHRADTAVSLPRLAIIVSSSRGFTLIMTPGHRVSLSGLDGLQRAAIFGRQSFTWNILRGVSNRRSMRVVVLRGCMVSLREVTTDASSADDSVTSCPCTWCRCGRVLSVTQPRGRLVNITAVLGGALENRRGLEVAGGSICILMGGRGHIILPGGVLLAEIISETIPCACGSFVVSRSQRGVLMAEEISLTPT